MSWDLYLDDEWIGNYTHNTNKMIRAASIFPHSVEPHPGVGAEVLFRAPTIGLCWGDLDGRPARDVIAFIDLIREELVKRAEHYDTMNPPNGWGSRRSLLAFMSKVEAACREQPDAIFKASG